MADGIVGVEWNWVLCGIIWSVAMGFAAGNYACSLVFRLPRNRPMLEHKPYCGSCGTPLATKDLFPVVSALLLGHKCRYCKAPIPISHFWTEVLIGILFVACFYSFNFSQEYLLVAAIGTFLITLSAIQINDGIVMDKMLIVLMVLGMVTRVLFDNDIYGFFIGGLYGLIIGTFLWRNKVKRVNHIYSLPSEAKLFIMAGICVGWPGFLVFLPLVAIFSLLTWLIARALSSAKPLPLTIPVGIATIIPLLWPKVVLVL